MRPWLEPLGLTSFILIFLKLAQFFLSPTWISILVPALLLYSPLLVFIYDKRKIDFLDYSWQQFRSGLVQFLIWTLILFPPYFLLAHLWMRHVIGMGGFQAAPLSLFTQHLVYQLLVVALPEEFYFRGYLQSRLNQIWLPQWRILGIPLGWSWIVTALLFAFAHSVIQLQWWHFSIFFPALIFGYLREKTGSITAPILFHTFSNCFMQWFTRSYIL